MDKSVAELCVAEPDQGLWASVGVRLPLDDSDKGDVQVYLSMAFCTFLVKCEGKGSLPFAGKLCFVAPSDSPLPITISPRPGSGPELGTPGAARRWQPAQAPRRRRAAGRPRAPGAWAPRRPSPARSAALAPHTQRSRAQEPRAWRGAARPGALPAGSARGAPLQILRPS